MLNVLKKWRGRDGESSSVGYSASMRDLVADLHYEIVPMKSIDQAIEDLPPDAHVSVTCSPAKGIAATQECTERLIELGHRPVPHLSARLVEGPEHVALLAAWLRAQKVPEVFVVAGDATEPAGPYEGALPFIRDLLAADPGVDRIGITGYPDGHAMIDDAEITRQLHAKQAVLAEAGVGGWVSTQMCFDEAKIRSWLMAERAAGLDLPVQLGVPGVVDRARLMTMGTRLGIGASMRYLAKNRSTVMHMMSPGGFDPTEMVIAFADDARQLGIEALHSFTFNAVADTRAWQEAILAGADEV
jgi:methylenetetrahydrofolate reductase (NADPH)